MWLVLAGAALAAHRLRDRLGHRRARRALVGRLAHDLAHRRDRESRTARAPRCPAAPRSARSRSAGRAASASDSGYSAPARSSRSLRRCTCGAPRNDQTSASRCPGPIVDVVGRPRRRASRASKASRAGSPIASCTPMSSTSSSADRRRLAVQPLGRDAVRDHLLAADFDAFIRPAPGSSRRTGARPGRAAPATDPARAGGRPSSAPSSTRGLLGVVEVVDRTGRGGTACGGIAVGPVPRGCVAVDCGTRRSTSRSGSSTPTKSSDAVARSCRRASRPRTRPAAPGRRSPASPTRVVPTAMCCLLVAWVPPACPRKPDTERQVFAARIDGVRASRLLSILLMLHSARPGQRRRSSPPSSRCRCARSTATSRRSARPASRSTRPAGATAASSCSTATAPGSPA